MGRILPGGFITGFLRRWTPLWRSGKHTTIRAEADRSLIGNASHYPPVSCILWESLHETGVFNSDDWHEPALGGELCHF